MDTTEFQYIGPCPRLTAQQEAFITEWWPMLAAGAWAFFLEEDKIPAVVIDATDLSSPFAAQPTALLELIISLQETNPELEVGELLEGFRPEQGLAVLFYEDDRATNFVTLATDLTPPIAYGLWELWEQNEDEKQPDPIH